MHPKLFEEMARVEDTHWWFCARRKILMDLLTRYLPPRSTDPHRVLDLGAGTGKWVSFVQEQYEAEGLELSGDARSWAQKRGVKLTEGHLPDGVPFPPESFDAFFLFDVLEHIENDHASLRAAGDLLVSGGYGFVTVPAHPWLFCGHDVHHHHHRRYSHKSFHSLLENSGLTIELAMPMNFLLAPLAVPVRLLQKLQEALLGLRADPGPAGVPPKLLNSLFFRIFASEIHWTSATWVPPGLSWLAVLRRV